MSSISTLPLIPITATFALPLTLYYTFLQARVIRVRMQVKQSIAQTSPVSTTTENSKQTPSDPLLTAVRCQQNFIENVPLALLLAALVEANGGSRRVLITALSVLSVARVLHVEKGLLVTDSKKPHTGFGRPVGFLGTVGVVLGLAGYGAWLGKEAWVL